MKKFLAISADRVFLPDKEECGIFTTEAAIARKVKNVELIAASGYQDVTEDTFSYLTNVANNICLFIGEKLNGYHGVNFSEEEWRLLLLADIRRLIQVVYERYQKIIRLSPEEFRTCGIKNTPIIPSDVADAAIVNEDCYNTFIYSTICEALGFEIEYKDYAALTVSEKTSCTPCLKKRVKKAVSDPKAALKWVKRKLVGTGPEKELSKIDACKSLLVYTRIASDVENDIIHRHPNDIRRLDAPALWRKGEKIASNHTVDMDLRKRLFTRNGTGTDIFEDICFQIVSQSICIAVLEAFQDTLYEAKRIAEHVRVEKIYTSADMFFSCFLENLCGVYLKREGAKCYHIQHAAPEALMEAELAGIRAVGFDAELTWGWKREEDGFQYEPRCITRTPSFTFVPIVRESNRILVIAPPFEEYNHSFVELGQLSEKYFQFLDNLNPQLYKNVVVRVRDSLMSDFCQLHRKYKGIRLETAGDMSFEESAQKSTLVICTYYSTCHVEVMCADVPCVMFECFNFYGINPVLADTLKSLKRAGILHTDGKSAAEFVSGLDDYRDWWKDEGRRAICADYLNLVAGDYRNLSAIWEAEFMA